MAISAAMVKELRERTGSGLMDCKKALQETNGDIEAAIENMRKSGQAKAAKKAGRIAAEGVVFVKSSDDQHSAIIIEINSETDFVARDDNFTGFAAQVATRALAEKVTSVDALAALSYGDTSGETIDEARKNLIAKIGENISIRRCTYLESDGVIASYVHGGRIGVIVELQGGDVELGKDIAMHVAANNPQVISQSEVPEELVAKEKEIFTAQAIESGKPPEIVEKMIGGRINKFLDEVSLLGQPFVKDPATQVAKLLKAANAEVKQFVRYEVGEGIEKKEDNFVADVMAQVSGD